MIFWRTSGLSWIFSKSSSQRSTPMAGQSEPNMALSCRIEFTCCTSSAAKYLGDQPDRSM